MPYACKNNIFIIYIKPNIKKLEEEFKCKKEFIPQLIIKKYNEETLSKIDKNSKKNNK